VMGANAVRFYRLDGTDRSGRSERSERSGRADPVR
jgi:hypothetical protein